MAARLYGSMSVSMTLSPLHFYCISAGGGLPFCSRGASSTPLGLQWADLDQNFSGWGVAAWCGRGWVAPGPVPPSHLLRWGCVSAGAGARFCCGGVSSLPLGPRCAGLGQGFFGWGRGRRARPPAGSADPTPPRHAGPADARAARPPARQTARPRAPPGRRPKGPPSPRPRRGRGLLSTGPATRRPPTQPTDFSYRSFSYRSFSYSSFSYRSCL